jgi:small subunit ribosomal protein S21
VSPVRPVFLDRPPAAGRLAPRSRGGNVPAAVFVSKPTAGPTLAPAAADRVTSQDAEMIKIKSRGNETAEQMLRRFKKMCEKEGLTKDIKRVAYYEKPSEKRRRRARSKPRIKPIGGTSSRR